MQPATADIKHMGEDLYLVTLCPPITGFEKFVSAWVFTGEKKFVVDVGPSVTSESLFKALQTLGTHTLDYIFLTHIHLDHAGGIGEMARFFPKTPIVCHKTGIPHLIDPTRLWEGTVKTLGAVGKAYGPVRPVSAERFVDAALFESDLIKALITPGHAAHHVSYLTGKNLFAGEAGGVCLELPSGDTYLRPATPPRFFLDTTIRSIDELLAHDPAVIHYGHYGSRNNAVEMLEMHKGQLLHWERVIGTVIRHTGDDSLEEICLKNLLASDSFLKGLTSLDDVVQKRELGFLKNSIRGFLGYLQPHTA